MTRYEDLPDTMPDAVEVCSERRQLTMGFPAAANGGRPFPLTPEAAAQLVERGYSVIIEGNAGDCIHYTDEAYTRRGATTGKRSETLTCDIVVSLDGLTPSEIGQMRRGAVLLMVLARREPDKNMLRALMLKNIHSIDLNSVYDVEGHRPMADTLNEVEGCAAMTVASFMLAHPERGKGIMLGGVTGVISCEVVVLGSDIGARAAARSALAQGTIVRMLDNDSYGLRTARMALGPGVVTSSLNPHVLENSLRSADIVIASGIAEPHYIDAQAVDVMKKGVIVMDLTADKRPAFPSLPEVSVTDALHPDAPQPWGGRVCYTSPGRTVPRTAAMAISNTLLDIMYYIGKPDATPNPMTMTAGVRSATCTLRGRVVDVQCALAVGERPIDINLLNSCS